MERMTATEMLNVPMFLVPIHANVKRGLLAMADDVMVRISVYPENHGWVPLFSS